MSATTSMWSIMIYEAFPKPNESCHVLNHIDYSLKANQLMAIFNLDLKKTQKKIEVKIQNVDRCSLFAGALTGKANSGGPVYEASRL